MFFGVHVDQTALFRAESPIRAMTFQRAARWPRCFDRNRDRLPPSSRQSHSLRQSLSRARLPAGARPKDNGGKLARIEVGKVLAFLSCEDYLPVIRSRG